MTITESEIRHLKVFTKFFKNADKLLDKTFSV